MAGYISLALNLFHKKHGAISGLMFVASIGGAIGPMVMGYLADFLNLKISYSFLAVCYLFILYVSTLNYSQGFKPLFSTPKKA